MNLKAADAFAKKRFTISDNVFAVLLIVPALIVLGTVVALPILKGIYVSFCDYTISNLDAPVWNHFQNYLAIFADGEIILYFKNTIIYVALAVGIQYVLGLAIALLLNTSIKGRGIFRGLFLIPWTIPSVVVALLFRWMLHQQFGVLNYLFFKAGLSETINIAWLQMPGLAMASVVMAAVWRQLPYMAVMILAGLQSVDYSLVEAARIDGASGWKVLTQITLPAIRPVIATAVWIAVLANFQMFTIVYNMTGGGPVDATTTLGLGAYKAAFQSFDFGKGSTIGVVWMAALFVATLINNKMNEKYDANYQ